MFVIAGLQKLNGIKETTVAGVKERSSIFPSSKQSDRCQTVLPGR